MAEVAEKSYNVWNQKTVSKFELKTIWVNACALKFPFIVSGAVGPI